MLAAMVALAISGPKQAGLVDKDLDLQHAAAPIITTPVVLAVDSASEVDKPLAPTSTESASATPITGTADSPSQSHLIEYERVVEPGENISIIFADMGLRASDLATILIADQQRARSLQTVRPGDKLVFRVGDDTRILQFDYYFTSTRYIRYSRRDGSTRFDSQEGSIAHDSIRRFQQGTIYNSLYVDALASGMSASQVMELAQIFAYDIDFAYQLRPGDSFRVLYEQIYRNGEAIDAGPILLAEFDLGGETLTAIRYVDPNGSSAYFTPEGKAMKTRFLRVPMEFARISSGFSLARKHPILHTIRRHTGVDYVADYGSEIFSVGNGTISRFGTMGGYGRTVIVDHGDGYSTLYAHLSRYARGLKQGMRVRQQQVIGYLGSSGLATGPHLHYEFRRNNKHLDPQKVKLPRASKLSSEQLPQFLQMAAELQEQADLYKRVAQVNQHSSSVISLP